MWLAIFISLPLQTFATYLVTNKKSYRIQGWNIPLGNCFNYIIGTLLGENVGAIWKIRGKSLRLLLGIWICASLILGASFGGNLRAFLLKGTYEKPINTADDILKSGIKWDMKIYGEEVEADMAQSIEPAIQALWKDKQVADMTHCQYQMTVKHKSHTHGMTHESTTASTIVHRTTTEKVQETSHSMGHEKAHGLIHVSSNTKPTNIRTTTLAMSHGKVVATSTPSIYHKSDHGATRHENECEFIRVSQRSLSCVE